MQKLWAGMLSVLLCAALSSGCSLLGGRDDGRERAPSLRLPPGSSESGGALSPTSKPIAQDDAPIGADTETEADAETAKPTDTVTETDRDLFFRELPGVWWFDTHWHESGDRFNLDIDEDGSFVFDSGTTFGSSYHTGRVVVQWNETDKKTDCPDTLTFDVDAENSSSPDGGTFEMNLIQHQGIWRLYLRPTSGELTMLDDAASESVFVLRSAKEEMPSSSGPKRGETFLALLWEIPSESRLLWLDETEHLQSGRALSVTHKTTRYQLARDAWINTRGFELTAGMLYLFTTDANGVIIEIAMTDNLSDGPEWQDGADSQNDPADPDGLENLRDLVHQVWPIVESESTEYQAYLDMGMTIMIWGDTSVVNGVTCYDVVLGTDHEEHFVREVLYTVDIAGRKVYVYDPITGGWSPAK